MTKRYSGEEDKPLSAAASLEVGMVDCASPQKSIWALEWSLLNKRLQSSLREFGLWVAKRPKDVLWPMRSLLWA